MLAEPPYWGWAIILRKFATRMCCSAMLGVHLWPHEAHEHSNDPTSACARSFA